MRIAVASMASMPNEFSDDAALVQLLAARSADASIKAWDDVSVDWTTFDLVVIRSTWNYSRQRETFLAWADAIGDRLHNPPQLVRWNSDKTYLRDLADAGIAVVDTLYVAPGDPTPAIERELVIKPTVSAGARDTGRFDPAHAKQAAELIGAIHASGRTAMVQPYLDSVDTDGEIAIVFIDGRPTSALRKGAVLLRDEVAPVRDDELGAAEVMYDPDLVQPDTADAAELESAEAVVAEVTRRFGRPPLYARVDQLHDSTGAPVLLELEAVEPSLYFEHSSGSADRLADAIISRTAEQA